MKKKLVTLLMVSALAATVFAGCSKKGGDAADAGADAATDAAAVTEAVAESAPVEAGTVEAAVEETVEETVTEEAAPAAGATDEAAAIAALAEEDTAAAGTTAEAAEYVDEEADAAVTGEAAAAEEAEALVVEPGTVYTVRFGGNIYSSPEENDQNIMYYANPDDYLTILERLDNYWYKVSYYLAGEGVEHQGYIQIQ